MKLIKRLWDRLLDRRIHFGYLPCEENQLDDCINNDFDLQIKGIIRILTYKVGSLKYYVYWDLVNHYHYLRVHVSPTGMYHLELFSYYDGDQRLIDEIKGYKFCPSGTRLFYCIPNWEYQYYKNRMDELYRKLCLQYNELLDKFY